MKIKGNFVAALTFPVIIASVLSPTGYLKSQNDGPNQNRDKVIEKIKDFNPPVDITLVKSRAGVVELDKKFLADEDWFKGLTINVHNKSDKPITYMSLHLYFPRPKEQESERDFGFTLQYGVNPIWVKQKGLSIHSATPVLPGEKVELTLPDMRYDFIRTSLKELGYPMNIKTLRMSAEMLGFSDGTIWLGDEIFTQDDTQPGKLIPLKKKTIRSQKQNKPFAKSGFNSFR